mmetsp:Transcript_29917/g.88949  ORF Transcript_29917/g.88949 Transcript_29917/m.88949 type:complete len:278 (+) Transcript_29917:267-1100(+)
MLVPAVPPTPSLLLRPEARADAEYHEQQDHKQSRRPRPARRRPLIRVLDKDVNERLKKSLGNIREQAAVVLEVPIRDERIGAPRASVLGVEAAAEWLFLRSVHDAVKHALAPSSAVGRAEHVRAGLAKAGALDGGGDRSSPYFDAELLEVLLACVPLSANVQLENKVGLDALGNVASPLFGRGLEAHGVFSEVLRVDVEVISIIRNAAVELVGAIATVGGPEHGAVVGLARPTLLWRIREVLELLVGKYCRVKEGVVHDCASHFVREGGAAPPLARR